MKTFAALAFLVCSSFLGSALAAEAVCKPFRWVTLGTAAGPVPTPDRSEPSNLLIAGAQNILVDAGDGTVVQLAKAGISLGKVQAVFISHHHHDHTGGLSAVIGLRWMNMYPGVLMVYGPKGTQEMVDGIIASLNPQSRIGFGVGRKPALPADSVTVVEVNDGDQIELGGVKAIAAANSHFDHNGPKTPDEAVSLSYRFELDGRSITYTGDTGPSDTVTHLASGTDMFVSEVMDLKAVVAGIRRARPDASEEMMQQMEQHMSTHHLTAEVVGQMAAKANVGRVVLTHFAIPGPLADAEGYLRRGVGATFSGPIDTAIDLASFDIGCQ